MNFTTVGQILGQENNTPILPGAVSGNGFFLDIVAGGNGELEAATHRGGRYNTDDLRNLPFLQHKLLCKIVAGVCWRDLRSRGGRLGEQEEKLAEWSNDMLEKLTAGERIFAITTPQDAATTQSRAPGGYQNPVTTSTARRYFGNRIGGPCSWPVV